MKVTFTPKIKPKMVSLIGAVLSIFVCLPTWSQGTTNKSKYQPQPNLKVPVKATQRDLRVVPQPGKPEFKQPPPDVVGPDLGAHPHSSNIELPPPSTGYEP